MASCESSNAREIFSYQVTHCFFESMLSRRTIKSISKKITINNVVKIQNNETSQLYDPSAAQPP